MVYLRDSSPVEKKDILNEQLCMETIGSRGCFAVGTVRPKLYHPFLLNYIYKCLELGREALALENVCRCDHESTRSKHFIVDGQT